MLYFLKFTMKIKYLKHFFSVIFLLFLIMIKSTKEFLKKNSFTSQGKIFFFPLTFIIVYISELNPQRETSVSVGTIPSMYQSGNYLFLMKNTTLHIALIDCTLECISLTQTSWLRQAPGSPLSHDQIM